ncbi:hypothetical protein ACFO1B_21575 [Dactylosporangium siamense]|uniref:Uncharacterized protein n=1 Tax=Dactylosporangium siamense TaxID=685454 RepID=A0A919PYR3_9ACTN|nr:hypothetical protein [Dactylosporangium siamense]GIG50765.1 hypothetical protein Dsi01nite_088060 [Dactylosporangium siamense]
MTGLIASLGQKITERWLAAILLPGLLYVAVVGWATVSGQAHALDFSHAGGQVTQWWQQHGSRPGELLVTAAVALFSASLAGLAATAVANEVVHRLWLIDGPQRRLTTLRNRTRDAWRDQTPPPPDRYLPARMSVIGEHFRLIGERVHAQYGLSATAVWPRIWMIATDDARTVILGAHRRYRQDAALVAWGLLAAPWTVQWWPASVIAVLAVAAGWRNAVFSSAALALLVEATIDTYTIAVANVLGVRLAEGRVTPIEGNIINDLLTKRAYTGPPRQFSASQSANASS